MKTALATLSLTLGTTLATAVHAHEGHGMPGVLHWHVEDVLALLALAVAAVGVAWYIRRK
jgi:hypothetical protein